MTEYIDKGIAINIIEMTDHTGYSIECVTDITDLAVKAIKEMPTADVVEVVHGEWIQHDEGVYQEKEKNWWHCSNCGNVIYSEHEDDRKEFHKWCGRCGAYMRGEDDGEIH